MGKWHINDLLAWGFLIVVAILCANVCGQAIGYVNGK